MNREAWLEAAVKKLKPIFKGHGYDIPDLRVSVGWPSSGGLAKRKLTIGQCWYGVTAADGRPQLFISPLLDEPASPSGVLATLVHEVVHTIAGPDAKHGAQFKKIMTKVGLEGKATSTSAGEDLIIRLTAISTALGPFPHSRIVPSPKQKAQTTRMLKCVCPDCEYTVRLARKWLDVGEPICPRDKKAMPPSLPLELPEDDE